MATEVVMPQMGESIAEGTITRWLKKVGERVERDEPLFEISTDKVDAEIPSPAAGVLTEVKFNEGDTVEVNKVIAILDGDGGAAATSAPPAAEPAAPEPTTEPPAPVQEAAQAQEAETPAPTAIVEPGPFSEKTEEPIAEPTVSKTESAAPPPSPAKASPQVSAERPRTSDGVEDLRRTKSSPLVRKIASEHGIDITGLEGTGMSGRVTKNDILSYIEAGPGQAKAPAASQPAAQPPAPARTGAISVPAAPPPTRPAQGDHVEQMSVMRKKIAEHMVLSRRTSAHVTTVYEIDMTKVARIRDKHRKEFYERTGTKLTFMPFIFQAITTAIRKFPIFNAQVSGDQIIYKRDINLGMAVALDWGLIVPVIKRADDLSISGLARAANDLADRARTKQLKPDEVGGGTFTITNPGVFGGLFGTPIINQPQVAILGVGKIEKRAKVLTSPDDEDYIAIRWMCYFALSFDHRVIDGSDAEKFLAFVKETLEEGDFAL
ncbi:MAG TPA: dihydrolipoamide acetyltransferase family protein [Pyrinomonadaceae bacterium]|nr:dihydrolipoamide acetyltransferase family protein [Pyrinomonadaceae bacterium]